MEVEEDSAVSCSSTWPGVAIWDEVELEPGDESGLVLLLASEDVDANAEEEEGDESYVAPAW